MPKYLLVFIFIITSAFNMAAQEQLVYLDTEKHQPEDINISGDNNVVFYGDNIVLNRVEVPEEVVRKIEQEYQNKLNAIRQKAKSRQLEAKQLQAEIKRLEADTRTAILEAQQLYSRFQQIDFEKSSSRFKAAYQAFTAGDFDTTLELLSAAQLEEEDRKNADNRKLKASIHAVRFEFSLARENYERASFIYEVFVNVFDYAYFLLLQTDYEAAKSQFERSLALSEDALEKAIVMTNLGMLTRGQQRPQESLQYYEQALPLFQEILRERPEYVGQIATAFNNVGNVFTDLEQWPAAKKALDSALAIRKQLAKIDSAFYEPELATTLMNIGLLYRRQQKLDTAIQYYRQALPMNRKLSENGGIRQQAALALLLNNLGDAYHESTDLSQAQACYKEALSLYRQLAQANPAVYTIEVATVLNNQAYAYYEQKQYDTALIHYGEAIKLYQSLEQRSPVQSGLGTAFHNSGLCHEALGAGEAALTAFQEAEKLRRMLAAPEFPSTEGELAQTMNSIGNMLADNKEWEDALRAYQEAFDIRARLAQASPQAYTLDMSESLINIATLYIALMWEQPAQQYQQQAIQHLKDALSLIRLYPHTSARADAQKAMAEEKLAVVTDLDLNIVQLDKELNILYEQLNQLATQGDNKDQIKEQLEQAEAKYLELGQERDDPVYAWHFSWVLEALAPSVWQDEQLLSVQKKVIRWREAAFTRYPEPNARLDLATSWGVITEYYYQMEDYTRLREAAGNGLAIEDSLNWIKIYLCLAYILEGNTEKAIEEVIYELKDTPYDFAPEQTYQEVLLDELKALAEQGKIADAVIEKARQLFE